MKKILFLAALTTSVFAQAALLNFEAGPVQLNGIVLNKTATVSEAVGVPGAGPADYTMDLLGAGLRSKTVLVTEAKVYVAQLFSGNKAGFSRDENALKSLVDNSGRVALRLDMLRTVTGAAMAASFKEALQANGLTLDAELTKLLTMIEAGAEATAGKYLVMYVMQDSKARNNVVYYQDAAGKVVSFSGSEQLLGKVLSIWLGKPADKGLATLKTQLLKPVY